MLTINQIGTDAKGTILILKGKLMGSEPDELKRISDRQLKLGKTITMDLSQVRFIDFYGMRIIAKLICTQNVQIVNCPFYIMKMIEKFKCL